MSSAMVRPLTPRLPLSTQREGRAFSAAGLTKGEWMFWVVLLMVINAPLFFGGRTTDWMLFPALGTQEIWRWITHPLAHVSLYHLLLDASTFLALLHALPCSRGARWFILMLSGGGSTLGAVFSPIDINLIGFGGLSGIAHGLAVALGGLRWRSPTDQARPLGLALAAIVLAKSVWEVCTGGVFLAGLHPASIGTPIVACHLGGALAGGIGCLSIRHPKFKQCPRAHTEGERFKTVAE